MTANPGASVDIDEFTVTRTVRIHARVDRVWQAITDPIHIAQWLGSTAELDGITVGSRGVFGFEGYGQFPVRIDEVDPPHMIAFRWSNASASPLDPDDVVFDQSTVFRYTLEPVGEDTVLTVVESGFGSLPNPGASLESNRQGWNEELDELVAYLEGGA